MLFFCRNHDVPLQKTTQRCQENKTQETASGVSRGAPIKARGTTHAEITLPRGTQSRSVPLPPTPPPLPRFFFFLMSCFR